MSETLRLLLVVCQIFLLAATPSLNAAPVIAPDAQPVLDQFLELYQKAKSFQVNARQIRRLNGKADADSSMQIIARKPNEARIQIMAANAVITFVSDGKQLIVHQAPPNTWVSKPASVTIQELTYNMLTGLESLTATDVRATVLDDVKAIRLGKSKEIGGKPCWLLEFEQTDCTVDCWISKEPSPSLARIVLHTKQEGQNIEMETTYSGWVFDPVLDPATFQFHPPSDAEEGGTVATDFPRQLAPGIRRITRYLP